MPNGPHDDWAMVILALASITAAMAGVFLAKLVLEVVTWLL